MNTLIEGHGEIRRGEMIILSSPEERAPYTSLYEKHIDAMWTKQIADGMRDEAWDRFRRWHYGDAEPYFTDMEPSISSDTLAMLKIQTTDEPNILWPVRSLSNKKKHVAGNQKALYLCIQSGLNDEH